MKLLYLSAESDDVKKSIFNQPVLQSLENERVSLPEQAMEAKLLESDIAIVEGLACGKMNQFIQHRSVGSHFLNYVDLVVNRGQTLWGESVFAPVFYDSLYAVVKNHSQKGPVIFLGQNPLVHPILEVLAKFGFSDFDFLKINEENENFEELTKLTSCLLKTRLSTVNSSAFIRSQKEYALCFVADSLYSDQILEDMSYFHFLSTQSVVFDMVGESNFHFSEVKALGVAVTEYVDVQKRYADRLHARINSF